MCCRVCAASARNRVERHRKPVDAVRAKVVRRDRVAIVAAPPRPKRAKPEAPVAVYRPSCRELFLTDGDRCEGACGMCKGSRYTKAGANVPLAERYSKERKPGYADMAGTRWKSCRHPDGPNGRGR